MHDIPFTVSHAAARMTQVGWPPNECTPAPRRLASPLNDGRQFENALCNSPSLSAAVVHRGPWAATVEEQFYEKVGIQDY
jgi:hypothetical protein